MRTRVRIGMLVMLVVLAGGLSAAPLCAAERTVRFVVPGCN